jgi:hypothetical protein
MSLNNDFAFLDLFVALLSAKDAPRLCGTGSMEAIIATKTGETCLQIVFICRQLGQASFHRLTFECHIIDP